MSGDEPKAVARDDIIQAIARAMVGAPPVPRSHPPRASSRAKRLTADRPTDDEQRAIFYDLHSASDMNIAITGVAYLERGLEDLLRDTFIDLNKEDDTRIFDGRSGGVLGGFASKIRIAYAVGLFGPKTYSDLMLMNDIRNTFAHSLHRIDFTHPDVIQDCQGLQLVDETSGRDWSEFTAADVPRYRFFLAVADLHLGLLTQRTAILFKRRGRSLIEVLQAGVMPKHGLS